MCNWLREINLLRNSQPLPCQRGSYQTTATCDDWYKFPSSQPQCQCSNEAET